MKPLIAQRSLKIQSIPSELILRGAKDIVLEQRIRNYFVSRKVFTIENPIQLEKLKMTSNLIRPSNQVVVLLYLFGTKGEIMMKEFTYFKSYDFKANEIPLTRDAWDLINNTGDIFINAFAFVSKEQNATISFELEEIFST